VLRLLGTVAALAVGMLLLVASAAGASQRYASPAGGGESCTAAAPCSLATAIVSAKSGDEVIIGGGEYMSEGELTPRGSEEEVGIYAPVPNVSIHGDFGASKPVLKFNGEGLSYSGILLSAPGQSLSWVDIRATGELMTALGCGVGTRIERVRASSEGAYAGGIGAEEGCTVSDSVVIASGLETVGIGVGSSSPTASSGSITNTTVIAAGPGSVGVSAAWSDPSEFTSGAGDLRVELTNSIARGTMADLLAAGFEEGTATIVASHSNFVTTKTEKLGATIDAGGNQTAQPLFVDATAGNFAEAPGSPTIDAGVATPLAGSLDLAGNARTQGGSIDIGAYELVVPPVPPALKLTSLAVKPKSFAPANIGGAVISIAKKKPKKPAKVGAKVSFGLSAAGTVSFTVERKTVKRVGKKHKKKVVYKALKGSFSVAGYAAANTFKFSGRVGGKGLKPGSYRLVGTAGGTVKRASFGIVK
jgi:hypothetical protein